MDDLGSFSSVSSRLTLMNQSKLSDKDVELGFVSGEFLGSVDLVFQDLGGDVGGVCNRSCFPVWSVVFSPKLSDFFPKSRILFGNTSVVGKYDRVGGGKVIKSGGKVGHSSSFGRGTGGGRHD